MAKRRKSDDDILDSDLNFDDNEDVGFDEEDDFGDFFLDSEGKTRKRVRRRKLKPMSTGRIVWVVFVAIAMSALIGLSGYVVYKTYVTYPQQEVVDFTQTGLYCLGNWEDDLKALEIPFEISYLNQEITYANGDENKIAFYKKMLSTVEYHPYQVVARNVYGNDFIDRSTNSTIEIDSSVVSGEIVGMEVVDYDAFDFDSYANLISSVMSEHDLSLGDVDYENKLVDVFLDFMLRLPEDEIPTKIIDRAPFMSKSSDAQGYVMDEAEDVYLDKLLFSSYQFYDCLDRFSYTASEKMVNTLSSYLKWDHLSDEEKENTERPDKYPYKECCSKLWCGTYYLQNEHFIVDSQGNSYISSIRAKVGDGSIGNPLGLYTDEVTSVFYSERNDLGNITSYEEYPIRVELIDYGYSQDAINYFEAKDIRNRGISLDSDVQYCYMIFNVTNLSDKELTIPENMGLCDENGNMQARTGNIYGLQSSVTLKPDESGIIETWQSSTSLWKKYVVWGNDFDRRQDLVFFRLLAGDIENTDEFKGVTVNTTRDVKE